MDLEHAYVPSRGFVKCCDCRCNCCLTLSSSGGTWIRSVKRKYNEFEERRHFYVPGLDHLQVVRVEIENECVALREMVGCQQNTIQDLYTELEEERDASSTAANEAMSMILRLQGEKAELQMEAQQFKRFAEEKMAHDAQEIAALEDLLYKKDQVIESLTCEVQAYKHRMMSYGLTEDEAEGVKDGGYSQSQNFADFDGQVDIPTCSYPPLKCNMENAQVQSDSDDNDDDVDLEKYPFGETPRSIEHLKRLDFRISQLERTSSSNRLDGDISETRNIMKKVTVGQSPRSSGHSRRFSADSSNSFLAFGREIGTDYNIDSPRMCASFKKMDCVVEELRKIDTGAEFGDDMSDRVYTIDSVHHGPLHNNVSNPKVPPGIYEDCMTTQYSFNQLGFGDAEIRKLYLRLQALEADRESLKQTIMSMQTEKAQLVLLREVAQQLCKDMSVEKRMPPRKPSTVGTFSFVAAIKWVWSFIFQRKKARPCKYTFGLSPDNVGLLMLLEKAPQSRQWRCVLSTQRLNAATRYATAASPGKLC